MKTFYYTDKREITVQATAVGKGTLECHAYMNTEEVNAEVEIVGVGTYTTPFTVDLNPATYTLIARYADKEQTKTAEIKAGETTRIDFQFGAPVIPIAAIAFIAVPIIYGSILQVASK